MARKRSTDEQAYLDSRSGVPPVTLTPTVLDNGQPVPSGVNWDSGTEVKEIDKCIEGGDNWLVWHTDHGASDGEGWVAPCEPFAPGVCYGFGTEPNNDIAALTEPGASSGELPIVWSADCDSGKFDDPTESEFGDVWEGVKPSFGESWLIDGKAIAFIGASRLSIIGYGGDYQADEILLTAFGSGLAAAKAVHYAAPIGQLFAVAQETQIQDAGTASVNGRASDLEYNLLGDPALVPPPLR